MTVRTQESKLRESDKQSIQLTSELQMWQAIKNVATYGTALVLVLGALVIASNIACCGVLGTASIIGTQIDEVVTSEEVTPTAP